MADGSRELLLAELTCIDGKFCENIGVLINTSTGIIEDVYDVKLYNNKYKNIKRRYFKNKALIPGLINCHSHAFQRGLRGFGEEYPLNNKEDNFWSWREKMYNLVSKCNKKEFYDLVYQCFYEMRRSGITSVGEFHYFHHSMNNPYIGDYAMDDIILTAAKDVGIRIVLLETYYHSSGCGNKPLLNKQKRFYTKSLNDYFQQIQYLKEKTKINPLQTVGIVAHSIRAANINEICELHRYSVSNNMIMHMHIDEQIKEIIECKAYYDKEPTNLLLNNLNVDELNNLTTVHNTLTNKNDLYDLVKYGGKICVCPLTECNLGDGIFDFHDMSLDKTKKIISNICVGTDCNERIDLFEELRMLEYSQRLKYRKRGIYSYKSGDSHIGNVLFKIGTINGSNSLRLNNGEIKKNKLADLVCIDLLSMSLSGWTKNTLLSCIIFGASGYEVVSDSCIHGKWIHYKPNINTISKL